jgi:N-acetylglutamate synthase
MNYTIEPMLIGDYEEVFCLWQKTSGVGLGESDGKANIEIFLERNSDLSFVARNERGEIVGAVLCGHDGRRGHLYHLAVEKTYRKRGIGKRLAEQCLLQLEKSGIQKCNIVVYADNEEGKSFWRHNGWGERADLCTMQYVIRKCNQVS